MSQVFDCIASVVVYDTSPQVLQECIKSFLDTKLKVKIYVIDNSAVEGYYSLSSDDRVFYHFNHGRNVGFGKGHNIAFENAEVSKYYLVLNPNVFIKEDALEKMIQFMDRNSEIGIGTPKVLNLDGTPQYLNKRYPTLYSVFVLHSIPKFFQFLFLQTLEYSEMRDLNQNENYEVPFISGVFMLFRRDVLEKVKGFDSGYFLHFGDLDICRKIQSVGYRTSYYAKTNIVFLSKGITTKNWKIRFLFISNMIRYFNKWGWKLF
ncbi:MAG: glycosyltransferase [Leptospiraceae bacterium]|nr:glycosyltransferase [Leptospiraceae bacterium]